MMRAVVIVACVAIYFSSVLVIAAAHYAVTQAIWPTPDGRPGPIAGAILLGLVILPALPLLWIWRRGQPPAGPASDDPLGADDE